MMKLFVLIFLAASCWFGTTKASSLLDAKAILIPPSWFAVNEEFEPMCLFESNQKILNYEVDFTFNGKIVAKFTVSNNTAKWQHWSVEGLTVIGASWSSTQLVFIPRFVSSVVDGQYFCAVIIPVSGSCGKSDEEVPAQISAARYQSEEWNALAVQLPPTVTVTYHHDPFIYIEKGENFHGICNVNMSLAHQSLDYIVLLGAYRTYPGYSSSALFRVKGSATGSPTVTFETSSKPSWGNVYRGTSSYPEFSVLFAPDESTRIVYIFHCTVYIDLPGGGEATFYSNEVKFGN